MRPTQTEIDVVAEVVAEGGERPIVELPASAERARVLDEIASRLLLELVAVDVAHEKVDEDAVRTDVAAPIELQIDAVGLERAEVPIECIDLHSVARDRIPDDEPAKSFRIVDRVARVGSRAV